MSLAQQLFRTLADGEVHSGEALADAVGVTRSAVWKAISQLRELGLDIEAQTNRGYRLVQSCEPLDVTRIRDVLGDVAERADIRVLWEVDSTNRALLEATAPEVGNFDVLLAENQTGGRGRRGRAWRSALGGSLCLSIATRFEPLPRDLPALTLAVGACVREALQAHGAERLALKWPNDLVVVTDDALIKLGGILVELRAEAGGPAHVVVGIGLNLRLDAATRGAIAETGTIAGDLETLGVDVARRNALAGAVVRSCISGLLKFGREGFAPFLVAWRDADALRDRRISVLDPNGERTGIARGIDAQGALQLDMPNGKRISVLGGEVSVRREDRR